MTPCMRGSSKRSIPGNGMLRLHRTIPPNVFSNSRAPPSVLNVANGQPVELRVAKRTNEDYVAPSGSSAARTFAGQGHRLGSPVPSLVPPTAGSSSTMPGSFPATSAPTSIDLESRRATAALNSVFEVDRTKPTTTVQLRLADGSRLAWRANLDHTVGDLRGFLNASVPLIFCTVWRL